MRKGIFYIIVSLLAPLVLCGAREALSEDGIEAKLIQKYPVDLCGSEFAQELFVFIDIGDIAPSDSLYGFNFQVSYNEEKIRFTEEIWHNTISQSLETKLMSFGVDSNVIRGSAVNVQYSLPPASGSGKYLCGFYGKFLSECPDTVNMKIDYIEFTDEFGRTIEKYTPLIAESSIPDNPQRLLKIDFNADTLDFKNDSIKKASLVFTTLEDSRLSWFNTILEFDTEMYKIEEIEIIDDNFEIIETTPTDNGYYINVRVKNDFVSSEAIELTFKEIKKDSGKTAATIRVSQHNDCSCVTRTEGSEMGMISYGKPSSVSERQNEINNDIAADYDAESDEIRIRSEKELIKEVRIFDVNGEIRLIENYESPAALLHIGAQNLCAGAYIAAITTMNNDIIVKKLIKL